MPKCAHSLLRVARSCVRSRLCWLSISVCALAGWVILDTRRIVIHNNAVVALEGCGLHLDEVIAAPRWYSPLEVMRGERSYTPAIRVNGTLAQSHFAGCSLRQLKDLDCLEMISLNNCNVDDLNIIDSLPHGILMLDISYSQRTKDCISRILKRCKSLRMITLVGTVLYDEDVDALIAHDSIKVVDVTGVKCDIQIMRKRLVGVHINNSGGWIPYWIL